MIGTKYKRNPAVLISQDALKLMRSFLTEFGLTPSSRSRVHISPPTTIDPLDADLDGVDERSRAN